MTDSVAYSQRAPASVWVQVLLVLALEMRIYNGFFTFLQNDILLNVVPGALLVATAWEVRKSIVWQDFFIGCVLLYCVAYYRFVSYAHFSSTFGALPLVMTAFSIGLLFRYTRINARTFWIYLFLAFIPFAYTILVLKVEVYGDFMYMNRNSISRLLIFAAMLQVLNESLEQKRYIIIVPSMVTVFFSFLSESRAGLLVSLLLLGLVGLYNSINWYLGSQRRREFFHRHKWIFLIGIIVIGIIIIMILQVLFRRSRFAEVGFKSSGRAEIYSDFLSEINLKRFLFGHRPIVGGVNLHNSFLTLFSYYGIVSFWFNGMIIVAIFRLAKTSKFQAGLLVIWCLYSLPESHAPFSVGLFVLLPLLMLAYPPKRWNTTIFPLQIRRKSEIQAS